MNLKTIIGLDIGGTKILAASWDKKGKIRRMKRVPTPVTFDAGIALINSLISDLAESRKILGIGAAIGGPLDWKKGIVSPLHQPAWRNVHLKAMMEKKWQCPFRVDVDTNIAALGEYASMKKPPRKLLYLTLSTGLGGGLVVDGKIYRGINGSHPEIGHQSVNYRCANPEKVYCECGAKDCLEALISGNGIRRIYGRPAERIGKKAWQEVYYNLGQGLRNLAAIYQPDIIVLGGKIAVSKGKELIAHSARIMKRNLFIVPCPMVRLCKFGERAPLIGALHLARNRERDRRII